MASLKATSPAELDNEAPQPPPPPPPPPPPRRYAWEEDLPVEQPGNVTYPFSFCPAIPSSGTATAAAASPPSTTTTSAAVAQDAPTASGTAAAAAPATPSSESVSRRRAELYCQGDTPPPYDELTALELDDDLPVSRRQQLKEKISTMAARAAVKLEKGFEHEKQRFAAAEAERAAAAAAGAAGGGPASPTPHTLAQPAGPGVEDLSEAGHLAADNVGHGKPEPHSRRLAATESLQTAKLYAKSLAKDLLQRPSRSKGSTLATPCPGYVPASAATCQPNPAVYNVSSTSPAPG